MMYLKMVVLSRPTASWLCGTFLPEEGLTSPKKIANQAVHANSKQLPEGEHDHDHDHNQQSTQLCASMLQQVCKLRCTTFTLRIFDRLPMSCLCCSSSVWKQLLQLASSDALCASEPALLGYGVLVRTWVLV